MCIVYRDDVIISVQSNKALILYGTCLNYAYRVVRVIRSTLVRSFRYYINQLCHVIKIAMARLSLSVRNLIQRRNQISESRDNQRFL